MLNNRRRPLINDMAESSHVSQIHKSPPPYEAAPAPSPDLKLIYNEIREVRKFLKVLEEKLEYIDMRQKNVEEETDKIDAKLTVLETDFSGWHAELASLRQNANAPGTRPYGHIPDNTPMMPGTGFSSITPEYLKNLQKR